MARLAISASGGPFERQREAGPDDHRHAIPHRDFPSPASQAIGDRRLGRVCRDQRFIRRDGAVELSAAIEHEAEQLARQAERRVQLQRALQRGARLFVAALEIRRRAGAQVEPGVARVRRDRLPEQLGGRSRPARLRGASMDRPPAAESHPGRAPHLQHVAASRKLNTTTRAAANGPRCICISIARRPAGSGAGLTTSLQYGREAATPARARRCRGGTAPPRRAAARR